MWDYKWLRSAINAGAEAAKSGTALARIEDRRNGLPLRSTARRVTKSTWRPNSRVSSSAISAWSSVPVRARLKGDEYIDVAVWPEIVTQDRAKQFQARHPSVRTERFDLPFVEHDP